MYLRGGGFATKIVPEEFIGEPSLGWKTAGYSTGNGRGKACQTILYRSYDAEESGKGRRGGGY